MNDVLSAKQSDNIKQYKRNCLTIREPIIPFFLLNLFFNRSTIVGFIVRFLRGCAGSKFLLGGSRHESAFCPISVSAASIWIYRTA